MRLQPRAVDLPVSASLPAISAAAAGGSLVLTAAPGAGKSTLVPFAVDAALARVRDEPRPILVLEPRRLAARATAARLAELLGEEVGHHIGLTIRGERRVGPACRIEVVTEAVLTNRLQRDPELPGVAAVVFDEFHERNLHSDLGLAMCVEIRETLRPDLVLVVMSATIDAAPIARLLGNAPVIDVPGRTFEVETEHRVRPSRSGWSEAVARAAVETAARVDGDVLVFAPGRWEIDAVVRAIRSGDDRLQPIGLHGGSDSAVQRSVLQSSDRQRIIVATSIAETSVTIPGVEAVVDGGLTRRARYDPATGIGRLETGFVSRFSADQRRGRAGRTGPGRCIRLWSKEEDRLLATAATPEIVDGDPLPLAAELLAWGDPDGTMLPLLDRPSPARLASARNTLRWLGIVDHADRLTDAGRRVAELPTHPRHGALLFAAANTELLPIVSTVVAILDDDRHPSSDDLLTEVDRRRNEHGIRRAAERLRRRVDKGAAPVTGRWTLPELLAAAWPDRVATVRPGRSGRFLLAAGREVGLRTGSSLARNDTVVVLDATVDGDGGQIRLAVGLDRRRAFEVTSSHVEAIDDVTWDARTDTITAERQRRLGAIVIHREPLTEPPVAAVRAALRRGLVESGLDAIRWTEGDVALRHRLAWLHSEAPDRFPDVGDDALLGRVDDWLDLDRVRTPREFRSLRPRLLDLLDWKERADFDELAPSSLTTAGGRRRALDYGGGRPVWRVRIQDLFGTTEHPVIGPNRSPITIELLSPADRVAQTTTDLAGFWAGSYAAVRADLRGRYPKHAWPEDPAAASPPAPPRRRRSSD